MATSGKGQLETTFATIANAKSDDIRTFHKETNGIRVHGVMTTPNKIFKNRQKCWFSINHRMVESPIFFKALQSALSDVVPKQHYPAVVCNIECDTKDVDINIHPKEL